MSDALHVWTLEDEDWAVASTREDAINVWLTEYTGYTRELFLSEYGEALRCMDDDEMLRCHFEEPGDAPDWIDIGKDVTGPCTVSIRAGEWAKQSGRGHLFCSHAQG